MATAKLLPGAHIVRAFNAINYAKLSADAHRQGELVGVPIAGDDPHAIGIASTSSDRLVSTLLSSADWRWANIWFPERRSAASIRRRKSGRS